MRRARVDRIPAVGASLQLDAEASRHLVQVLRLPCGSAVALFDGDGHEAPARLLSDDRRGAVVVVEGPAVDVRPQHALWLGLGVLKGPAMDLAVRHATEAGVTHLLAIDAARAVPKAPRLDRCARIAASAAAQCGRADVPTLLGPVSWEEAFAQLGPVPDRRIAVPGAASRGPSTGDVALLVGPEGGFTDAEVDRARAEGFQDQGLGRWILRASTAAAVGPATVAPAPSAG